MPKEIVLDQGDHSAFLCVQNVAHVLLNKGRLNLAEICHYTKLKTRSAQGVIIASVSNIMYSRPRDLQRRRAQCALPTSLLPCPP
jgi:uncharacterized cupin superfamily protein